MIVRIIQFELKYWLRQPMVYIFLLINAMLVFGATTSDNVQIGGGVGNVMKNAPYVVENFYGILSLTCLLMITAFLNSAAARDFTEQTHQILFTTPIKKRDFLFGRYIGACIIAVIPFLGISLGNWIGSALPWSWADPERMGPQMLSGHLQGLLVFAIPNTLFAGAIIFSIAALTRNTVISFVGSVALMIGYIMSQNLIRDIDSETLGSLLDPFGIRTFSIATKYWTVDERNTLSYGYQGLMLLNRLLWLAVASLVMVFTYYRFTFSEKSRAGVAKKISEKEHTATLSDGPLPKVTPDFSKKNEFKHLLSQIRIEFKSMVKNTSFVVILILGMINLITSLTFVTDAGYGNTNFPVTYSVIDSIQGSLFLFLMIIVIFYSGTMVWKERDAKVSDIYDALPFSSWIPAWSKTIALFLSVELILILSLLLGVCTQWLCGFHNYKLSVYFYQLIVLSGLKFFFYIALSVLIHTLINNKYLAYFIIVAILIVDAFLWDALNIESNMVSFGSTPNLTYSDMNGFGPYTGGLIWFNLYWFLFCIGLILISMFLWSRGREVSWKWRLAMARQQFSGPAKTISLVLVLAWLLCGSFIYYNTRVLNSYKSQNELEKLQVKYEKTYKKFEKLNQPRITDIHFKIDLFPKERKLHVVADCRIANKGKTPITEVHFSLPQQFKSKIQLADASLRVNDTLLDYQIYHLKSPLNPGDTIPLQVITTYEAKGFENEVSVTSIVDNGSFFNSADIMPSIGYQSGYELDDKYKRKEYGLKEKDRMPQLERNCTSNCMNTYISNCADWVNVETIFSTDADQLAIAPGSLLKEWKENDRHYFQYKLDHYSLNFYSFISARYTVARDKWKDVSLEVYYIPEHQWNVPKMLSSLKHSLAYYTENFGPYMHQQARIIEFPRYASFAQAFPGTMPYSEGIGFIENLEDSDAIDMVYYVVAHETGHQWWAHQVTGAEMQGATLLSETQAQYSALMVMEKMYGKAHMQKFLKYEMDRYLRSRGSERVKETAILKVENQGYIHYNKGSVLMYYLKEMIGEKQVNAALKNMIDSFAYRQPPYPTAYDLVDRFEAQTPDSLKYLIKDLFYDMTLFNNRTISATAKKRTDGKYEVNFEFEAKKMKADSVGHEKQVRMNDWITVGIDAKPLDGKKYGKRLWSKLIHVTEANMRINAVVDELPYKAGVDPDFYLIDRVPDDNMKKVSL